MAQMIPSYIDPYDRKRNGERMVFDWFSDERIKGTVYYSLLQKNHKHKLLGEVDFLYVSERGFLCIEVKGGKEIFCRNKKWYSVNKNNTENEIKNPFIQAKDCMYALKTYFNDIYGKNSFQAKYLIGYAVVFPESIFTGFGNDLVTEVMFDARYNIEDFSEFLERTYDYWESIISTRNNYFPLKLTDIQLNQANDLLRGDFRVVPSMNLEMQHVNRIMLQMTDEQYDALDVTEYNRRVVIQGVAGTGKSLLALEKVRKNVAKGKKVLYVCFNNNMAKYAGNTLKNLNSDYCNVSTYHALLQKELLGYTSYDKSVNEISNTFLINKIDPVKYDYLVVDEAQDLMYIPVLDVLDKYLSGGLDNGEWVMFLDPNQNLFNNNNEYNFSIEYLRESCSPAFIGLSQNCRNTKQIGRKTSVITHVPHAKHMKISGPKVVLHKYEDKKKFIKLFKLELQSLLTGGISPKDIVVLSRFKLENSILAQYDSVCNLNVIERSSIDEVGKRCLNYFTIQSFKGLESKVVLLIDIAGFTDYKDRILNYVAMSRAKIHLYMFFEQELEEEYYSNFERGAEMLNSF